MPGNPDPGSPSPSPLLLHAEDRVLRLLRDAELHDALGGNLDLFAGGRIAAHARLAVDQDELTDTRDREAVLRFLVGERRQVIEELRRDPLRRAGGLRQVIGDLRFRQRQPWVPSFRSFLLPEGFDSVTNSARFRRKSCREGSGAPARLPGDAPRLLRLAPISRCRSLSALLAAGHDLTLVVTAAGQARRAPRRDLRPRRGPARQGAGPSAFPASEPEAGRGRRAPRPGRRRPLRLEPPTGRSFRSGCWTCPVSAPSTSTAPSYRAGGAPRPCRRRSSRATP